MGEQAGPGAGSLLVLSWPARGPVSWAEEG